MREPGGSFAEDFGTSLRHALAPRSWKPGGRVWIGATFFLMAFAPGLWFPALAPILRAHGHEHLIAHVYAAISLCGILSPLLIGAWADQKLNGERLLALLSIGGAGFLWLAFHGLKAGWPGELVLALLGLNALVSGPMWALLGSITFAQAKTPEKSFPFLRVWGTIGWLVAGFVTSLVLQADQSTAGGTMAAFVRVLVAMIAFLLVPATPPLGGPSRNWRERLGLGALVHLRGRDERVFLLVSFLLAVALHPFLMLTPLHLEDLGVEHVTAKMTLGQLTEIPAILLLGVLATKFRFKHLLLAAIVFSIARYLLFTAGAAGTSEPLMLAGITLHGLCYTLFFVTGQLFVERRVDKGVRSQAQAFYGLVSFSLGAMLSSHLAKNLHEWFVTGDRGGWAAFWSWHCGFVVVLLAVFAFGYRGKERTVDMHSSAPGDAS